MTVQFHDLFHFMMIYPTLLCTYSADTLQFILSLPVQIKEFLVARPNKIMVSSLIREIKTALSRLN